MNDQMVKEGLGTMISSGVLMQSKIEIYKTDFHKTRKSYFAYFENSSKPVLQVLKILTVDVICPLQLIL